MIILSLRSATARNFVSYLCENRCVTSDASVFVVFVQTDASLMMRLANNTTLSLVLRPHIHEDLHGADGTLAEEVEGLVALEPDLDGFRHERAHFANPGKLL